MTESEERAYQMGRKAFARTILAEAVAELGHGPERDVESWRLERADTVAMLRSLCETFGDNDWPDNLHLADVIDKHLGRHLHAERRDRLAESE